MNVWVAMFITTSQTSPCSGVAGNEQREEIIMKYVLV